MTDKDRLLIGFARLLYNLYDGCTDEDDYKFVQHLCERYFEFSEDEMCFSHDILEDLVWDEDEKCFV